MTFVLPARNAAGGTRVTVAMANELLQRGHGVRLAVRKPPGWWTRPGLRRILRGRPENETRGDWIEQFRGTVVEYRQLDRVHFDRDEFVIAIGTYTTDDVYGLSAPVRKLRWCHGFPDYNPELKQRVWSIPLPTFSVSPNLIPQLEQMMGRPVLGIVPNGIYTEDYHRMADIEPDGIGALFSPSPKKAPEDMIALFAECERRWPDVPRYCFGAVPKPPELRVSEYHQLPPVDLARRLYNRACVWVLTSRSEGFGLPILEAMACGAAVVSTDHDTAGGLIIDGHNGLLAPVGDVPALVDRIGRLLHDDTLRNRYIQNGYTTADHYTWPCAAERLEALLDRAVTQPAINDA